MVACLVGAGARVHSAVPAHRPLEEVYLELIRQGRGVSMAFRPKRALAVFWKDFLDLRKNLGLLLSMTVLPLVFVLVPIGVVWTYVAAAG